MKTLGLITILFVLPASLPAGEPRTYLLKDDTVITAEILEVNANEVRLKFFIEGGSGIVTRDLADFVPSSQFNILRAMTDKEDFEGHIKLAEFAVQHGLIGAGRKELFAARKIANDHGIAPELEEKLIDEAVKVIDELLRSMVAEGRTKEAKHLLREIMHAPRLSNEQKQELIALVHDQKKEIKPANSPRTPTKDAGRTSDPGSVEARELTAAEVRHLKPIEDRLAKGKAYEKKALMNSRSQSTAIGEYKKAIREFEIIQKDIPKIDKRATTTSAMSAELHSVGRQAEAEMISSLLGQASIYVTRSSFNDALSNIGKVLAIDAQDQQALDMRARIEIAANDDDDYWRGGVRRLRRGNPGPRTRPARRGVRRR